MSLNEIMSKYNKCNKDLPKAIVVNDKKDGIIRNKAKNYSNNLIRSNYDRINCNLTDSINRILNNGCIYLPNFVCSLDDFTIFNAIMEEINSNKENINVVNWSKHHRFENPSFSSTFNNMVEKVAKYFKLEVLATRLNYYKDDNDFKPYHHDSHAYSNNKKENFTFGISLGASRKLSFMHVATRNKFDFPQCNGDVFAFDDIINKDFMHGVPKGINSDYDKSKGSERISIIVWGKR